MRTISPRMAAEFAELVYQVRSANSEGNYRIPTAHLSLSRVFDLSLSDGPSLGRREVYSAYFERPRVLLPLEQESKLLKEHDCWLRFKFC